MKHFSLKRLCSEQSGSILMLVGLSLLFLFGIAGAGYDLGRQQLVRQKIQQSSDAAALAAAGMIQGTPSSDRQATAQRYFALNYPTTYLGVARPTPSVVVNANDVQVSATTAVSMSFVSNFGINTINSAGLSDAQFKKGYNKVDLILVMDNSGSMDGNDVGATSWLGTALSNVQALCVAEFTSPAQLAHYGGFNFAPSICPNPAMLGISSASRVNAMRYAADTLATQLTNPNPDNNQIATVRWDDILVGYSDFSTDYSTIHSDLLKMYAGGSTTSEVGMAKAQSLGAAGFRSGAVHAIVMLTDGVNDSPAATHNTATNTICTQLKAQGVLIYTIGLGGDINANAAIVKPFLSNCATGPNGPTYPNLNQYFFVAPNAAAMNAAFSAITGSLQAVRILD